MKNGNKRKMEFDQGINGIRGSFRYTQSMQLLAWILEWLKQKKKK